MKFGKFHPQFLLTIIILWTVRVFIELKKKIKNKNIFEVTALINEGLDEVINKLSEIEVICGV